MTKSNCRYESSFNDGVLEFRLLGEIDHHSAVNIRTDMDAEICEHRPKKVIIELRGIDFMDSSGLGLIIGRAEMCRDMRTEVVVTGLSPTHLKLVRISGIEKIPNVVIGRTEK